MRLGRRAARLGRRGRARWREHVEIELFVELRELPLGGDREELVSWIWPELPSERAGRRLSAAVRTLRWALEPQLKPGAAVFHVFDGSAADSVSAGVFAKLKDALPHEVNLIEWRSVESSINELAQEQQRRKQERQQRQS